MNKGLNIFLFNNFSKKKATFLEKMGGFFFWGGDMTIF